MNANELRIGNLIQIKLGEIEIAKVEELTLQTENNNQYYILKTNLLSNNSDWVDPIDSFEPIPITKEWLLNFGFERVRDTSLYTKQTIEIDGTFEDYMEYNLEFKQVNLSYEMCSIPLQYVHELQNIYFALSKKELTIKE